MNESKKNATLTLTIDGPLLRVTRPEFPVDRQHQIWFDALYWTWNLQSQLKTFAQAIRNEMAAGLGTKYDEKQRGATSYAEHLVLVAANHLHDVVDRLPSGEARSAKPASLDCLRLLRDVYEHWLNHRHSDPADAKAAEKRLQDKYPTARAWTTACQPDGDIQIGTQVSVRALLVDLDQLETALLRGRAAFRASRHQADGNLP